MKKKFHTSLALSTLVAFGSVACSAADDPLDDEFSDFSSGKADSIFSETSPEALAIRALVNDKSVDFEELDIDARLHATAARNIIAHRDGADELPGTTDDDDYDTLEELDDVPFVGPVALAALLQYATDKGLLNDSDSQASVVFSPQQLGSSHNARIAQMIEEANDTVDIAMYSYSSAAIADAIDVAISNGVDVRFIFETARSKDKNLTGSDLQNSKSGRLENAGVDVRFVNKIMHHKYVIVDGPRHDLSAAQDTKIASGSANWSTGGATIYDENTVFLEGVPEMALKMQREFDLMWDHSRELEINPSITLSNSSIQIQDSDIQDNPDLDIYFTSDNFDIVGSTGTTFRLRSRDDMALSDKWVEAIEGATDSIKIASGHMRLRPVAEALIAKRQANPSMDIQVYVDQQEYVSFTGNNKQIAKREACVANATSDNKLFDCLNKSFLWARALNEADIEIHFKYYAYRWHFSYAEQMHNKFMLIDGDELYTGSYNLSVNAEHGTFENTMHFKAPSFSGLVDTYEDYFDDVFQLGRGGSELADLRDTIETASSIPLVFESLALTYEEATSLKALIRANCTQVNTTEFRTAPQAHKFCPRL